MRILAPSLWGYSINWTLSTWVQAIGMADIPAEAALLGLLTHVPLNWLFVYYFNFGYIGCAIATTCFQIIQPTYTIGKLFLSTKGRKRTLKSTGGTVLGHADLSFWNELHVASTSIKGYMQYLSLGIPGIVIVSEWWASEIAIFLAGRLQPYPDAALGGTHCLFCFWLIILAHITLSPSLLIKKMATYFHSFPHVILYENK